MASIPHAAGIYCITCVPTNKVYIGSTTDLRKRWYWHKGDLRAKRHHNSYLQNAWNKYGGDNFTFKVLELVDVSYLEEREQHWLDSYQAFNPTLGFNLGSSARAPMNGYTPSLETRQKLSDHAKRRNSIAIAQAHAREWHGTEEGRAWHSEHGARTWGLRALKSFVCEHCDCEFETKDTTMRYCSNRCRAAARRARGDDNETRICVWCGAAFQINRYESTHCCSRSCASYWRESKRK